MTSSTPTELELSPSKARLAATTSLAWTRITSWLTTLFSPAPVPAFEQNPSTLAYLQQLMQANLTADQIEGMQLEVDRKQLGVYEGQQQPSSSSSSSSPSPSSPVATASATASAEVGGGGGGGGEGGQPLIVSTILSDCLTAEARDALDSMARTNVLLTSFPSLSPPGKVEEDEEEEGRGGRGANDHNTSALQIGQSMHQLTQQLFTLENQVRELKALSAQLTRESAAAQAAAAELETRLTGPQAEAELERMRLRTAQWARETKQIGLKTEEYERRIAALVRHVEDEYEANGGGGGGIELISETQTRVEAKRSEVRALEQRLRAFHGLPPDVEASRDEVKRAQRELDRWKTKREDMFQQM